MKKCCISTEECIHSRRCFMTGEYCSKQTNIQKERDTLEKDESITAFVIMNFSDMSNVIYKWRLKTFIESLNKYLYRDTESKKLYCYEEELKENPKNCKAVDKIRVVRADSEPVSNYVICSRICQQMQIADIVIVDVSNQNPNVFYEFGMAVAFGKLILPVCFSESFYKMVIPDQITMQMRKKNKELEHHIGCYPWRKQLFEYYGIRYRSKEVYTEGKKGTYYLDYDVATDEENGFLDIQYARFPYHEKIEDNGEEIGKSIYNKLRNSYDATSKDNTLIVYTIEGFLNEKQAGTCIINFYYGITAQMRLEQCFCGERVGVLVQENSISENDKDAKQGLYLNYNVGEIIHIGLNQATYLALGEKIKTEDFLEVPDGLKAESPRKEECENKTKITDETEKFDSEECSCEEQSVPAITEGQLEQIIRFTKDHIRNRGMMIYPNHPVYVSRIKNGLQKDVLNDPMTQGTDEETGIVDMSKFWCLYHVMIRTLRFTNEIVVDISKNCLQALFWLGAAHGSDIYAITVRHEETEQERQITSGTLERKERNVFDVSGLWTAVLHSNDTDGFSQQLSMAQIGIERHSKLMIKNREFYEKSVREYLSSYYEASKEGGVDKILEEKNKKELQVLESYYRKCFWNPMLKYNRLRIYLPQIDDMDREHHEPKSYTAKWDVETISELSHYLSKRAVIGEYRFKLLRKDEREKETEEINYICIGKDAKPREQSLPRYIKNVIGAKDEKYGDNYNLIHEHYEWTFFCGECAKDSKIERQYKGFVEIEESNKGFFMQQAVSKCFDCMQRSKKSDVKKNLFYNVNVTKECVLEDNNEHDQLAQLILWRDSYANSDRSYFRMSIVGSSGPATYGLSTLLVDYVQKREVFDIKGKDEECNLLCSLQQKIRKKIMDVILIRMEEYLNNLSLHSQQERNNIVDGEQKRRYISLVKHAVLLYLSTVLYRYFLPFLSDSEIKRIHNGVRTYISSMMAAKKSPFALNYPKDGDATFKSSISNDDVKEIAEQIPGIILNVLENFRGVEAFYRIKVKVDPCGNKASESRWDARKVLKVEELGEESEVNYLFTPMD